MERKFLTSISTLISYQRWFHLVSFSNFSNSVCEVLWNTDRIETILYHYEYYHCCCCCFSSSIDILYVFILPYSHPCGLLAGTVSRFWASVASGLGFPPLHTGTSLCWLLVQHGAFSPSFLAKSTVVPLKAKKEVLQSFASIARWEIIKKMTRLSFYHGHPL